MMRRLDDGDGIFLHCTAWRSARSVMLLGFHPVFVDEREEGLRMEDRRTGEIGDLVLSRVDVGQDEREERFLDPTGFRNQLRLREWTAPRPRITAGAMPQPKEAALQARSSRQKRFADGV